MFKYIIKRIGQSVLTIFIIISVVFLLMRLMPTDYFFTEDELIKLTEEQKENKLKAAGLLDNPFVQLAHFYRDMFTIEYTYTETQRAYVSENLTVNVAEGVHSAVERVINEYYTDTAAAEKEIDKINNKVLTEKILGNLTADALLIEGAEDQETLVTYLTGVMMDKCSTLTKDVKKVLDESLLTEFSEKLEGYINEGMYAATEGLNLDFDAKGFKNVINHLNPSNYRLTFWLGTSYRIQHGISVITVIAEKFPVSMTIGLLSLALALVVGVVMGILQARFKGGILDNVCSGYTIFVNAVPHLVSYTLIMYVCARVFNLPMTYRSNTPVASAIPVILCLAMGSIASYMLWMRRYMVDELNKDYIRLAQLKGLTRTQVMFRHVMKNAFLPLAQYLPYNVLLTVGGSLLAESFFSVPGMGPLLTLAISRYDINLVQAIVLFYAALGVMGVFLGDLLMGILDPRISLTKKGGTR